MSGYKLVRNMEPTSRQFYALGTINALTACGDEAETAIYKAAARLFEIDDKMSVFKEGSEVSRVNLNAGISPVKVSQETLLVMNKALEYSEMSYGAYDPTIRPLVDLWGIGKRHEKTPEENEIKKILKLVNYKDVLINENKGTIFLAQHAQSIDFGGIAKGFSADEVNTIFKNSGVTSAMVDLGGNIYVLGKKPDGSEWNVGIQNPFTDTGVSFGYLKVSNKSIVTSGGYERFSIIDGKRYHHILDPRTGYPVDNDLASVTVISDLSIDGDALSTCCFVLGLNSGSKLIESMEGIGAIFVTENKKVIHTDGVKGDFQLTDKSFNLETLKNYKAEK